MPCRRSHTKSHHGCLQCKQRRVKCDESTPSCGRCARRRRQCSFMEHALTSYNPPVVNASETERKMYSLVPPQNHSVHATSGSNSRTPISLHDHHASTLLVATSSQPSALTRLDLELVHRWSTQTYMTMTSNLTAHLVWRDVVFHESLKHDFLRCALLATAALHKATDHAEDTETYAAYIQIAFSYQNAALAGYMPAFDRPHADNAVALFILPALLSIWVFGSKRLAEALVGVKFTTSPHASPRVLRPAPENEPLNPLEILTYLQEIHALVKQTGEWLLDGKINTLLEPRLEGGLPPNPPDIEASFQMVQERIELTQKPGTEVVGHINTSKAETNLERLNKLRYVARARTVLEHDQLMIAWPATSGLPYRELIRQGDSMAIAIFVHWAACIKCLDHLWWAKGWSYRVVRDTSILLDDSWSEILVWPRKEVGLD